MLRLQSHYFSCLISLKNNNFIYPALTKKINQLHHPKNSSTIHCLTRSTIHIVLKHPHFPYFATTLYIETTPHFWKKKTYSIFHSPITNSDARKFRVSHSDCTLYVAFAYIQRMLQINYTVITRSCEVFKSNNNNCVRNGFVLCLMLLSIRNANKCD